MPHHNSVLHQVLRLLPWDEFDRLVAQHGADAAQRGFDRRTHLVALIYAQLAGASALREIEAGLRSHADRLYHLGRAGPACRATLAEANRTRPSGLFSDLFLAMTKALARRERRSLAAVTYLIDSTLLPLSAKTADWARFSAQLRGAKLHIIYDAHAGRPIYASVSPANLNDITAAQRMPIEAGATYVVDLGYYDYAWWAALDAAHCRLVSRLKTNTPLAVVETLPVAEGGAILSDRIGFLPARQANSRRNPMGDAIREVRVRIRTGKVLRLFSNDLDAPAEEIAELHRRRWDIELFFRWVKQTLRIRKFLGTTETAVTRQLAAALIAFLRLRLAQATQQAIERPLTFARLVRANLMHLRPLQHLHAPPPRPPRHDPHQRSLALCKT